MDNVAFNFSPFQTLLFLGLNAWIFIIFPAIVIRKLNRMTDILEAHFYDERQPEDEE